MLAPAKMKIVEDLVAGSAKEELIWLSGYLAGLVASGSAPKEAEPVKKVLPKITIAYGTETGTSKKLATGFAAVAKKQGVPVKLVGLDQYRLGDLSKEEYFLTVVSTHGEGEPPAGARKFYDHIHANGFKLQNLKYGVLALGDTSYPLFCKAGEDVDVQLNKLGGQRLVDLKKCDTDYEDDARQWFDEVLSKLTASGPAVPAPQVAVPKKATGKKLYSGTVLANVNLNDRGSDKQTHHLEIGVEGVDYEPGDALGIIPQNPQRVVDAVLALTGADGAALVNYKDEETPLGTLLQKKLNISCLPARVVKNYAALVGQDIPETPIALTDLLRIYPLKEGVDVGALVAILEPLAPRLYSISSSPEAHSGEVHLTVARDTFRVDGEVRYGLCSDFFSCLPEDSPIEFYIHKNHQFRLPADDRDVIMIGPGTGIAPFRSFLAHRDATGATGRNWLFFGDRHFTTDFLYQTEIQNWHQTGVLTRVNTAFSRDQQEKIYVQHRILEHAADVWAWLEGGASLYVCGAKEPMSVDVEATLLQVAHLQGGKTAEEAIVWLEALKEEGRYLKDVY
jgi:sulfite reductase (NADPH) flavoprotein alpha-component